MSDNKICKTCEDGCGYLWDSTAPCPDCVKGKAIQYEQDKARLSWHLRCIYQLRKKINEYQPPQTEINHESI